jgi:outer membrane protein OmpA-like peptidoglycan-associated protein
VVTGPTGVKGSDAGVVKAPDAVVALNGLELHNIYFDFDQSFIRTEARNDLDKVATLLQNDPTLSLEILGHTDSYGNVDYNQRLSDRRCQAALDYLLAKGISSEQAKLAGFSENNPLDTNETDAGRQNNRRVEFRVLKEGKVVYTSIP